MKRFALGIVAGVTAVFGGIAAVFAALWLFWPANLPPPALTPLVQLDLKLRFVRHNPTFDPHILALGSSIAWRQIDGAAFEILADGPGHFLNGASANLKIHQSRDLLNFYLANYENVRTVLMLVGLPDFDGCSDEPARLLDHDEAADYAFHRWPASLFYFRYFSPARYVREMMNLATRQVPFTGDLFLDAYGSGPVMVPKSRRRGLRYGLVDVDPVCVRTLIEMSHDLTARDLRFVIVFPPVNPEYLRTYPEAANRLDSVAREVARNTAGDRTQVLSMFDAPGYGSGEFYDAIHLQWPGAVRLSAEIAEAMKEPLSREWARKNRAERQPGGAASIRDVQTP